MKDARQASREPPHASKWQAIRDACDGLSDDGERWCNYPFCACDPDVEAILAVIEAEAKARGETA